MSRLERWLYWTLFVAGLALAAWLPAQSAFPELGKQLAHLLTIVHT
jgi:4-hydroxybenzoate polyprenyltransferase